MDVYLHEKKLKSYLEGVFIWEKARVVSILRCTSRTGKASRNSEAVDLLDPCVAFIFGGLGSIEIDEL